MATTAAKDGRRDERVQPVHHPAVAGNEAARILDAETPLERGFEQVAKLGHDRGRKPQPEQRGEPIGPRREEEAKDGADERADDRARPGLAGRDARPEPRAPDQPAGEIGRDVRSPDDREKPQDRGEAKTRTGPQEPDAGDERARVKRARASPRALDRPRKPPDRDRAEKERGDDARNRIVECEHGDERNRKRAGRHPLSEPAPANEPLPFPQDDDRREPPESDKHEAADPRRREREAAHRCGRRHARPEIRPEAGAGPGRGRSDRWAASACRHPRAPHDADLTAAGSTAPNRRSRAAY